MKGIYYRKCFTVIRKAEKPIIMLKQPRNEQQQNATSLPGLEKVALPEVGQLVESRIIKEMQPLVENSSSKQRGANILVHPFFSLPSLLPGPPISQIYPEASW